MKWKQFIAVVLFVSFFMGVATFIDTKRETQTRSVLLDTFAKSTIKEVLCELGHEGKVSWTLDYNLNGEVSNFKAEFFDEWPSALYDEGKEIKLITCK
jgi:hypothetical protein